MLAHRLQPRLPFFYGWVILACTCAAGFSRQGGAVATLSVFVEPMTREFGWSRSGFSGAVSLGGVLAAITAPALGRVLDRMGARLVLCGAVLATGLATLLLSATSSLAMFYLLFCIARTSFAGPFDLGIYGAVNNWFVARRPFATSIATVGQMSGLVGLPLLAQAAMLVDGWRLGWFAIGVAVLVVGFVPTWLLMVRRPEDMGLLPDRGAPEPAPGTTPLPAEPAFSRAQALRTPAFWLLSLFTLLVYPVQAGVSLHQAAFLIESGLDATVAAATVGLFSLVSGLAGLAFGLLARRLGTRLALTSIAALMCAGTILMMGVATPAQGYLAAAIFGAGIGGVQVTLPIVWGDYYGRRSFGAIRGVALSVQVLAQAAGPLISGLLRDWSGGYDLSLDCFAVLAALAIPAALLARRPSPPG